MDLLKNENGSTILEALVVIILIGILSVLTMTFFNVILNTSLRTKQEAQTLAYQELNRTISQAARSDSIYLNHKGNLIISRNITEEERYIKAEIEIKKSSSDSTIILVRSKYLK